jgi:hypothetical protein
MLHSAQNVHWHDRPSDFHQNPFRYGRSFGGSHYVLFRVRKVLFAIHMLQDKNPELPVR